MEANEEKWAEYKEAKKDIAPEGVVYIAESGIDMTISAEIEDGVRKAKN